MIGVWGGVVLLVTLAISQPCEGGKACVWKVSGGTSVVYLGGTVHLLRDEDHPIPLIYQSVYERCDRIVFEVNLWELESMEFRRRMMAMSLLPGEERLQDKVSPEVYALLAAYLRERKVTGSHYDRLKPAMIAMTVTAMEAARLGAKAELGVETVFDRLARAEGKKVAGLETADFQLELFERLTWAEQEELLRLTLENLQDTEKDLPELLRVWREGDVLELDRLLNHHLGGNPRLGEVILYERNEAWLPVIEAASREKIEETFFLVGVGHLVGEKGLVRLLQDRGFTVAQMEAE